MQPALEQQPRLYYRPLQPSDYEELKAIHGQLFPIAYEDIFYQKAVRSEDRVFSFAAVISGSEQLVGFVTARVVYLHECDPLDRHYMHLSGHALDGCTGVYILTLGVTTSWRKCGVASALLGLVHQYAAHAGCRAVFLHVIAYNEGAMRLYNRAAYQCVARLHNFYCLSVSRNAQPTALTPPDPNQSHYDAYLYMLPLGHAEQGGGALPNPLAAIQGVGAAAVGVAMAPLRNAWGHINSCMPWFCRQNGQYPTQPQAAQLAGVVTSPMQQPVPQAWPSPGGQAPALPASPISHGYAAAGIVTASTAYGPMSPQGLGGVGLGSPGSSSHMGVYPSSTYTHQQAAAGPSSSSAYGALYTPQRPGSPVPARADVPTSATRSDAAWGHSSALTSRSRPVGIVRGEQQQQSLLQAWMSGPQQHARNS
uniref:N-alpha-acetyltransferase 60 n=1 Tax=Chlamydomonas leiostraca TaxID=1034604 RepID=A0A7S0S3M9_9CHLO|mmetsp:Transcript_6756/g.16824  ORF Transcript_6756/g.16824 Transcript_6756/m.16824 type:complete len:422 (+) Transcript_6756:158-1423(+)